MKIDPTGHMPNDEMNYKINKAMNNVYLTKRVGTGYFKPTAFTHQNGTTTEETPLNTYTSNQRHNFLDHANSLTDEDSDLTITKTSFTLYEDPDGITYVAEDMPHFDQLRVRRNTHEYDTQMIIKPYNTKNGQIHYHPDEGETHFIMTGSQMQITKFVDLIKITDEYYFEDHDELFEHLKDERRDRRPRERHVKSQIIKDTTIL